MSLPRRRPGDELLAVAGSPYDTLEEVIGLRGTPGIGSLADWGVTYRRLPLHASGSIDWDALASAVRPGERGEGPHAQPAAISICCDVAGLPSTIPSCCPLSPLPCCPPHHHTPAETKVALVQRSCGYALRPTLRIDEIERAVAAIKRQNPGVLVLVDNCYGEFTADREPPAVGADLCMGSLIKNGGGTIVSGGGYVAGRADLVERSLARLTAPGVGTDAGCVPGETLRLMFQGGARPGSGTCGGRGEGGLGRCRVPPSPLTSPRPFRPRPPLAGLWLAPQTVGEALKGGRLVAQVLAREGFAVTPAPGPCSPWSFITGACCRGLHVHGCGA